MPVRNLLEDIHAEPFPEFHHALLMTRGAEVAALARKCQQIFMAAIFASPIRSRTSFTRAKPLCRSPPYQVRGRLHRDSDRSPARHMAARSRIARKNARHRSRQRFQNSPPRNGSNRTTVDSGGGRQRQ